MYTLESTLARLKIEERIRETGTIASAAVDAISRCPTHGGCECEVAQSYAGCPETAGGADDLGAGPRLPAAGAVGMRAHAAVSAVGLWTVGRPRAIRGHNPGTAAGGVPSAAARAVRVSLWAGRLAAPMVGRRHSLANGDDESDRAVSTAATQVHEGRPGWPRSTQHRTGGPSGVRRTTARSKQLAVHACLRVIWP